MITDIKKILNELSYRVRDGSPDLTNEQHLIKLYDVLKECQWPADARIELIKTLTEAGEQHFWPRTKLPYIEGIGYKSKEEALKTLEVVDTHSNKKGIIETLMNRAEFHEEQTQGMRDAHEVFKGYLTEASVKHKDFFQKIGARYLSDKDLTFIQNYVDKPTSVDKKDVRIKKVSNWKSVTFPRGGGKSADMTKAKFKISDFNTYTTEGKCFLTYTDGGVYKFRNYIGIRVCGWGDVKPNSRDWGRIAALYDYLINKKAKVEIISKLPAGISYEKMQVQNVNDIKATIEQLGGRKKVPVNLIFAGKDVKTAVYGADKIDGSGKADLVLDGKPKDFYISYKQGDYVVGQKVMKVPFQQYGSMKTYFKDKFMQHKSFKKIKAVSDAFCNDAVFSLKKPIKIKAGTTFDINHKKKIVIINKGSNKIVLDKLNESEFECFSQNDAALKKRTGAYNLYYTSTGWMQSRLFGKSPILKQLTGLAIFGLEFGTGNISSENVDVLVQTGDVLNASWDVDMPDYLYMDVTNKSHVVWNPDLYSGEPGVDTIGRKKGFQDYIPAFVLRHHKAENFPFNGDKDFIIGGRYLIMPAGQAKKGRI